MHDVTGSQALEVALAHQVVADLELAQVALALAGQAENLGEQVVVAKKESV